MKKYTIYIITNLINGKKYIGSHICLNIYDNYLGSGINIKNSIKKYGRKNFKKDILAIVENEEMMKEIEEYYIDYYNAYQSSLFYNATKFSSGITKCTWGKIISEKNINNKYNLGKIHSNKTKQQMSKIKLGKKFSQETRKKISNSKLGNNYALGNKMSDESKQKISLSKMGHECYKNPDRSKKISNANKGKRRSEDVKNKMKKLGYIRYKPILQFDLEGNFIQEFESGKAISCYLNKPQTTRVIDVCKGKCNSAYNYKWKYKN